MKKVVKAYRFVLLTLCSILLIGLVMNVGLQVSSRWLSFKVPTWTEEMAGFLLKWIVAIGCGLQFLDKDPIGIDVILRRMKKLPKMVFFYVNILIACGFASILAYSSVDLIKRGSLMRTPIMNMQYSYIYSSILVTGLLILISVLLRQFARLGSTTDPLQGE